jgi:hypothetical protein
MRQRRIKSLHREATCAYRDGGLQRVATGNGFQNFGEPFGRLGTALRLAYRAGYEAGQHIEDELPPEVWSVVLAEAMRR